MKKPWSQNLSANLQLLNDSYIKSKLISQDFMDHFMVLTDQFAVQIFVKSVNYTVVTWRKNVLYLIFSKLTNK